MLSSAPVRLTHRHPFFHRSITWALVLAAATLSACLDGHLDAFTSVGEAGSAGTAGAASGAAGAAAGGSAGASSGGGSDLLLDDLEDMNNHAEPNGWWYGADDDTGPAAQMSVESISGRGESQYAVRFSGGPTTEWGSFLGLDLPDGADDLSGFDELVFFARSDQPKTVSVRFLDPASGHYGVDVDLTTEWQEYRNPFDTFVRTDDSGEALDPSRVIHLQFWVPGESAGFQFWIDDVWLTVSR